jgi:hypothetical protein
MASAPGRIDQIDMTRRGVEPVVATTRLTPIAREDERKRRERERERRRKAPPEPPPEGPEHIDLLA